MLFTALGMVLVQIGFRAWAVYGSWFEFDDFAWLSMSMHRRLSWSFVLQDYAGHLMPGGFLLSWVFAHVALLDFWLPATTLLVLQAAASIGCLRLLRHLFGDRPGILPPLALYLFSVVSLPSFVWWAAGIDALPFQVALFFGLHSHVTYLRTHQLRYAFATTAWTLFGLVFFEKTLFVYVAYAVVALGYFATGWGAARLRSLWTSYGAGIALHAAFVLAYLAAYRQLALNFDPNTANDYPLGPIAGKLIGIGFGTGIVGGPLRWLDRSSFSHTPDPPDLLVLLSWLALGALLWEINRVRVGSRRAWFMVAGVLTLDTVLLAAARAFVVGPAIALEYRYQGEISAFAAIALALATMPLRGAVETVQPSGTSSFLDSPRYVSAATVAMVVLAMISSVQYAQRWQSGNAPHTYFSNIAREVAARRTPVDVANTPVPEFVLWGLAFPENQSKRMLAMFGSKLRFPRASENLMVIDERGRLRMALVAPVRAVAPGPKPNCGYWIRQRPQTLPFNGPVIGGGWWTRVGYLASGAGTLRIVLGHTVFEEPIHRGLGNIFVQADGAYSSITLTVVSPGVGLCTDDIQLGTPVPDQLHEAPHP
ncbi:MAG: hypothetical protein ACXVWU_00120 [Nocardioides sp.]